MGTRQIMEMENIYLVQKSRFVNVRATVVCLGHIKQLRLQQPKIIIIDKLGFKHMDMIDLAIQHGDHYEWIERKIYICSFTLKKFYKSKKSNEKKFYEYKRFNINIAIPVDIFRHLDLKNKQKINILIRRTKKSENVEC